MLLIHFVICCLFDLGFRNFGLLCHGLKPSVRLSRPLEATMYDPPLIRSYIFTELRNLYIKSSGFITAIVVNPPERKWTKHTSVYCGATTSVLTRVLAWFSGKIFRKNNLSGSFSRTYKTKDTSGDKNLPAKLVLGQKSQWHHFLKWLNQ